jgi:hypothetical protein
VSYPRGSRRALGRNGPLTIWPQPITTRLRLLGRSQATRAAVAVTSLAAVLAGCGSAQHSAPIEARDTAATHAAGEPSSSVLPPVDSKCVDANISDMSAPDLLHLIASNIDALFPDAKPSDNDMARQAVLQEADATPRWPWGDIPAGGLANYARAACDLLPAAYPNNFAQIQRTPAVMFLDAITECRDWNQQGLAKSKITTQLQSQATGDPKARTALVALQYICP